MTSVARIQETSAWIQEQCSQPPEIGLVLGSGLGDFSGKLKIRTSWDFGEIPHFKIATVPGHAGKLCIGRLGDKSLAVLQGRIHYHEGYKLSDVVFPVRVLARLGIRHLLLTNAAGGIHPSLAPGDFMIISDHLNLMGANPLRGEWDERLGDRFPDMNLIYDESIREKIAGELLKLGREVKTGIYACMSGPSYETPAEIRMLRSLGADAVGMSTAPEAIVGRQMGLAIGGISCITNFAAGISRQPLDHDAIQKIAGRMQSDLHQLLIGVINGL